MEEMHRTIKIMFVLSVSTWDVGGSADSELVNSYISNVYYMNYNEKCSSYSASFSIWHFLYFSLTAGRICLV